MSRWTWVYLAAQAALTAALVSRLPIIPDEAYYWCWSRAPALTYFDHPPGVAWVLAAATRVLGDDVAALRAPSLLAIAAILALATWLAGTARVVVLLTSAPMFALGYPMATHDVWQGLFALIGVAAVARADALGSRAALALAGVAWTVPVLMKHTHGILALGALAGLLTDARGRALVARPAALLGLVIGLALAAPWAFADVAAGELGSLHFQFTRVAASGAPLRPLTALPLALGSMAGTLGPVGLVGLGLAWAGRRGASLAERAALGAALALLASCVLAVGLGSGEANWPMPAWVMVAPFAAQRWRAGRWLRAGLLLQGVAVVVLLVHACWGGLPIRGSRDPFTRGAGFDELTSAATALGDTHGARAWITRRYQIASLLRYHDGDRHPVLELGSPRRRSQYDVWPRPALARGDVAVVVAQEAELPPELSAEPLGEPRVFDRRTARGAMIERWYLTPVRLLAPPRTEDR